MNRNLTGSIDRRSFIKIAHIVQIGKQTWPPWEVLGYFLLKSSIKELHLNIGSYVKMNIIIILKI
jgi:hypothetical protein